MSTEPAARRQRRFYYGWLIVGVIALTSFVQTAETLPVQSILLKPMTEEFHWSRTVFTGSLAIGTVLGGVLAIVMGPLIDRFGGRWILVVALSIVGGSVILLAFINSLWQFYVLQIIGRMVTMGVIALATAVIVPKWFVAKRSRAVAISHMGLRSGNSITPLYVQLFVNVWSWRAALAATGVVILTFSILPVAMFMRRRPEDMGLLPDGSVPEKLDVSRSTSPTRVASARSPREEVSLSLRQVVRHPSFYLLVTSMALGYLVFPGLNLHLVAYLTDKGISPGSAVWVLAVWSASSAVGAILFGLVAERFGVRRTITLNFALVATGVAFLMAVRSIEMGLLWGFYQGLAQGGVITLESVLFADYYGRDSLGAIRGVVWPVQMMANALSPLAASLAYDVTGNYFSIFTVFIGLVILASLCISLARPPAAMVNQKASALK